MLLDFPNLKAVLIDLDGTLVDSLPVLYDTFIAFMKKHGHESSFEEFCSLAGPSLPEIMTILNTKYQLGKNSDELLKQYHLILVEQYKEKLKLFPQALEFLGYAKDNGLKIALVTSAPSTLVQPFLETRHLISYFDKIVTPEGLKKSKPSPDIYRRALDLLKIEAKEALAIEDSSHGVEAAVKAFIPTIQIVHKKSHLTKKTQYDVPIVENWSTIIQLFRSYYE